MTPRLAWAGAGALALTLVAGPPAGGWGTPHTEITRHALRALPASDRLDARLGGSRQMEDLCWGGDYQHHVHARHYVDDYLVFPGFPEHRSHVLPQVADTWKPFFLRTLRALRGESPQNAARWLGSFLHFVEDTGSPPHALPTGGVLHTRMENYIYALDIRLEGYRPREPARSDEATAAEVEARMRELVRYSRERAEKLLPIAQRDDRAASGPLLLECAQETMRAVADVTHWLMVLSEPGPRAGTASVSGAIRAPVMPEFPLAPTKVMVAGAGYATVADAGPALPGDREYRAGFVLGDVPPGDYSLIVMRTGCLTARRSLRLRAGRRAALDLRLEADTPAGNLVRNPDLTVRWLVPGRPDHWTKVDGGWRADAFRVQPGLLYAFGSREREVDVRVSDDPRMRQSRALALDRDGRGRVQTEFAQLTVRGEGEPAYAFARPAEPAPLRARAAPPRPPASCTPDCAGGGSG